MTTPPIPDDVRDHRLKVIRDEGGNVTRASIILGISRGALQDTVRKAQRDGILERAPEGPFVVKGRSTLTGPSGELRGEWEKTRLRGRDESETVQIKDPRLVSGTSTLYDQEGRVTQQWVKVKPEERDRAQAIDAVLDAMSHKIVRVDPTDPPYATSDELLTIIPVGDHHFGLLAWDRETGADYDLVTADKLLMQASRHLMASTALCSQCLIAFLGDFLHYDGILPVTPTSGNVLASDSRFPKMVDVGVHCMRVTIDEALRRYGQVHVIVEPGNHDLSVSIMLMKCLQIAYEREPRVTVDVSPRHFHYFRWGKSLIATHHGHGVKPEQLPLIMATDVPELWGSTDHRVWLTGHLHTEIVRDYRGVTVETFRVLPPTDAWAHQRGFRSVRGMKAIVHHDRYGEVARYTFNPVMLEG